MQAVEEQASDLRHQRTFVKSIVQQISQVESYISHINKMQASSSQVSFRSRQRSNEPESDQKSPALSRIQSDLEEVFREKSGRLACMFNQIYKTLKGLNDDLIVKKKKVHAKKKQLRQQASGKELTDSSMIKVDESRLSNKEFADAAERTEQTGETPRSELANDYGVFDDQRKEQPMTIRLGYVASSAKQSEVLTPALGIQTEETLGHKPDKYGVAINKINAIKKASKPSTPEKEPLQQMVNKL